MGLITKKQCKKILAWLLVLICLVVVAEAIQGHRVVTYIWYTHLNVASKARTECIALGGLPITEPVAYVDRTNGIMVEASPWQTASMDDAVRLRFFRGQPSRLESVVVLPREVWGSEQNLTRAPKLMELAAIGGLFSWYYLGRLSHELKAYSDIIRPPKSAQPL